MHLPRAILRLIQEAFWLRRQSRGHRLNANDLAGTGLELSCQLEDLVSGRFTNPANCRLANHVLDHALHWFWFLIDPAIAQSTAFTRPFRVQIALARADPCAR